MTKLQPHNIVVTLLSMALKLMLPSPWFLWEEKSIRLGPNWFPEPDLAVVRGPITRYLKAHPGAMDLEFLIEVSDSSYRIDQGKKCRAYADALVPAYWIVNIPKRRFEVFGDPIGSGQAACYRQTLVYEEGTEIPVILEGREIGRIAVDAILPQD